MYGCALKTVKITTILRSIDCECKKKTRDNKNENKKAKEMYNHSYQIILQGQSVLFKHNTSKKLHEILEVFFLQKFICGFL